MIHEFSVENFLSFRSEQILSFEATTDKAFEAFYLVDKKSMKLLKLGLVYGANASGKTNLLLALDFLRKSVLYTKDDKTVGTGTMPFLLSPEMSQSPTHFHISFFINLTRYVYDLSMDSDKVVVEKLVYYPGTQPALVFERNYKEKEGLSYIHFGEKAALSTRDKIVLEGNTISNQTVLASYLVSNVYSSIIEAVVNWFKTKLLGLVSAKTRLYESTVEMISQDDLKRQFSIDALRFADLHISDIQIKREREEVAGKAKEIFFQHSTKEGDFLLPFSVESEGTQRYFGLTGPLSKLMDDDVVISIDEIESSLHYELVNTYLRTFLANSGNSQLLCSTHDINLLDEDFIRRDVVWFCEKGEDGSSELYPLKAFKMHKNLSILNAYKVGKLGAKPEPSQIYL